MHVEKQKAEDQFLKAIHTRLRIINESIFHQGSYLSVSHTALSNTFSDHLNSARE